MVSNSKLTPIMILGMSAPHLVSLTSTWATFGSHFSHIELTCLDMAEMVFIRPYTKLYLRIEWVLFEHSISRQWIKHLSTPSRTDDTPLDISSIGATRLSFLMETYCATEYPRSFLHATHLTVGVTHRQMKIFYILSILHRETLFFY